MSRYDGIIAELAARVPELAAECQPTVTTFLERCQRGSQEPLSSADIEYLRALGASNPDQFPDQVDEPLSYFVFENSLFPLLLEMLADPTRHGRLQEIMDWLEALQGDTDFDVRNLVGISVCEQLLGNSPEYLPALLPFLGENLRQSCRDCFSSLLVSEENKRLLS